MKRTGSESREWSAVASVYLRLTVPKRSPAPHPATVLARLLTEPYCGRNGHPSPVPRVVFPSSLCLGGLHVMSLALSREVCLGGAYQGARAGSPSGDTKPCTPKSASTF